MTVQTAPRIEVGHGHALGAGARAAGREAALAATAAVRTHPLSLVLVFASVSHDLAELLRGVREITRDAPLVGASTAGEIDGGELRRSVVVAALGSPEMTVHVGAAGGVARDWKAALDTALGATGVAPFFAGPQRWLEATRAGRSAFALLFTPGNTYSAPSRSHDLLEALNRRAGGRLPVFGGAAADDWRMETNFVLAGDRAIPDGVALAVVETSLQFGIAGGHGFQLAEERVVVTAASGHEALELDGRLAADRYAELAGEPRAALEGHHLAPSAGILLATSDAFGETLPLLATHLTHRGGVHFARSVAEGTVLRRLRIDREPASGAGVLALKKAILRGGVSDPALILTAHCAARPRLLGTSAGAELDSLARVLSGTPLVGFQSFGEQGLTDAGACFHANGVVSILALGRDLSGEARVARENEALRREVEERAAVLRQANEQLRRAQAQQRALLDSIPDQAWLKDVEGRYLAVNQSLAQLEGRAVEEMVGRTDHEIFDPERARRHRAQDEQVMASGAPLRFEQELAGASGRALWVEKIKVPFRDEQGRVAGTAGIARDMTHRRELEQLRQQNQEELERLVRERTAMLERLAQDLGERLEQLHRAEETLRESEEKYRMLVRGTPNSAVLLFDGDLRCTLAEGTLFDKVGVSAQAIVGRSVRELPACEHEVFAPMLQRAREGELVEAEAPALGCFLAALRAAPVRGGDGSIRGAMLVATDVTEQRKLEEQVRQAQKMEAVGRLAGGVAHDFNNMLTVILGSARDLRQRLAGHAEARELADEVLEAGQRAAALTRQLLAFSRQQALRPREIDVNEVVHGLEKMLRRLIGADIEIVARLEDGLGTVLADPGQLEQVVMNLVVNARDAMPKGGRLTLSTRTVQGAPEDSAGATPAPGPHVVVAVSDTGQGMDRSALEHIFEPFFTTKERGKGTGLGLATVFGIVKQSGGSITVHSQPGLGSTFELYLPCVGGGMAAPHAPGAEAERARGEETVLLVEDDAAVRSFMRRSLEAAGYKVLEAKVPAEAIGLAGTPQVAMDLLLTDVIMPFMGGPDLAAALVSLRPGLRVLFVSGYTENAALRSGALPAGQAFLQKPFTGDELARAVRDTLEMPPPIPQGG